MEKNKNSTASEIIWQERLARETKYVAKMNYLMAKALLTGKISSEVVRWAEELVSVYGKELEK